VVVCPHGVACHEGGVRADCPRSGDKEQPRGAGGGKQDDEVTQGRSASYPPQEGTQDHHAEASIDDQLAIHRGLPPTEVSDIPMPPEEFKPTEAPVRNRRLRRVADKSRPSCSWR
jgi:hypothetical protein